MVPGWQITLKWGADSGERMAGAAVPALPFPLSAIRHPLPDSEADLHAQRDYRMQLQVRLVLDIRPHLCELLGDVGVELRLGGPGERGLPHQVHPRRAGESDRSEERRVGKECRSRW